MSVPARLSFVTLAARDVPRLAAFYRSLGWPESKHNAEDFAAFQCGGAEVTWADGTSFDERDGLIFP